MTAYVHPLELVPTTCECCGTVQPMANGIARGQCRHCYYGRLSGWSWMGREACGYAGCNARAIAQAPRVGQCCAAHYQRAHKKPFPLGTAAQEGAKS